MNSNIAKVTRNIIPLHLKTIFNSFIIGIFLSMFFRFLFLLINGNISEIEIGTLLYALFNRGLLFDIVTMAYLLTIPFLWLSINYLIGKYNGNNFVFWYYRIILPFIIIIYISDIAYFNYFNIRFTKAIFTWIDSPLAAITGLFSNKIYYLYIACVVTIIIILEFVLNNYSKKYNLKKHESQFWLTRIFIFTISFMLFFLCLRGEYKINRSPLKIDNSFFSDNSFANQLGLNPIHYFLHSFIIEDITVVNKDDALKNVKTILNRNENGIDQTVAGTAKTNMNVILILMESMSANQIGVYNPDKKSKTPFLDSIAQNSLFYKNTYSAGIHTHNGIFSTLCALPTLWTDKPMTYNAEIEYSGLTDVLKQNNYQTVFFLTHDYIFDNMAGFLSNIGFDKIYHRENYPDDYKINCWGKGVPDHYMFEYSIERLDSMAAKNKPFFTTYITISTHEPHAIPDYADFKPTFKKMEDAIYEYADWSLKNFMDKISKKKWFNNTVFVFIADHGQIFDPVYEAPLSYHHIPLMIYSPDIIPPKIDERFALQMDVFPTVMGILGHSYTNKTLGVDLQKYNREYAFFSTDDKVGVLDNENYLIINRTGNEKIYKYINKDKKNYIEKSSTLADSMKKHAFSMYSVARQIIKH